MTILMFLILVLVFVVVWLVVKIKTISRVGILNGQHTMTQDDQNIKLLKLRSEFVLKALSAIIWEYDVVNNLFWSNNPESVLSGGMDFEAYVALHHPDDIPHIRATLAAVLAGNINRFQLDLRLTDGHGGYSWIEVHGLVYEYDKDGSPAKIVGLRRDIHSEMADKEEIIRNKVKLEEYAIQTELAMRSADIVVWSYDIRNEIFSSPNQSSFMYEPVPKDQFLSVVHPDDLPIIKHGLDCFFEGQDISTCRARVNLPDRGFRWIDMTATVLSRDTDGTPTKIAGIRRDITREVEMTSELIALRNQADKSNAQKSTFLANMSHEIRTPLNAIVGFSNLVCSAETDEQKQEYLKIIESSNELLLQLINDILDLSKIEAGKMEFFDSEINVCDTMSQLQQMFAMRVQSGVDVIFETDQEPDLYVVCDSNRLTQVIINFLSNAVKFTSHGQIRMGYKPVEQGTYFYVTDTGNGISEQNIPNVFQRFAKFDSSIRGTGLGLSISKTIIEKLGGQIGVESTLGSGSTFWIIIPGQLHTYTAQSEEDVLEEDTKSNESFKILIAEDVESNYKLYETYLGDYELIHAWNGQQAVELFRQHNPALVIMDIRMPVMDGYQAAAAIRELSSTIPILAITASALSEEKHRIMSGGFTAFMSKPLNFKELQALIIQYLPEA